MNRLPLGGLKLSNTPTVGMLPYVNSALDGFDLKLGMEPIEINTPLSAAASWHNDSLGAFVTLHGWGYTVPGTDGATLLLRTDANAGASFDAGGSDYVTEWRQTLGATMTSGIITGSGISLHDDVDTSIGDIFEFRIENFNKSLYMQGLARAGGINSAGSSYRQWETWFARNDTTARNALQLIFSTGTLYGRISLEGVRG